MKPTARATLFLLPALLTIASSPAAADNNKTPPGNPCAKGNGNPCNGNNGNVGHQGNVQTSSGGFIEIPKPAGYNNGAYITQIGASNTAAIQQSASTQYARVTQQGNRNRATSNQQNGVQFSEISQVGDDNRVEVGQNGAGENVLYVSQQGNLNNANVMQDEAGGTYNAAVVFQKGTGNTLSLTQDGSDNQAALVQDGENNTLTATQTGDANRLQWTQTGNGLSDLAIQQTGGANIQITQSNGGK